MTTPSFYSIGVAQPITTTAGSVGRRAGYRHPLHLTAFLSIAAVPENCTEPHGPFPEAGRAARLIPIGSSVVGDMQRLSGADGFLVEGVELGRGFLRSRL
jgi:hypothetical protein